jgi:hypothetical protein
VAEETLSVDPLLGHNEMASDFRVGEFPQGQDSAADKDGEAAWGMELFCGGQTVQRAYLWDSLPVSVVIDAFELQDFARYKTLSACFSRSSHAWP